MNLVASSKVVALTTETYALSVVCVMCVPCKLVQPSGFEGKEYYFILPFGLSSKKLAFSLASILVIFYLYVLLPKICNKNMQKGLNA